MFDDAEQQYRAVLSGDARFDGWFVTAVATTGIYCRPSCPARTPKRSNVWFFPTAAAAQRAGYRACKRCRPDASPGSPEWDQRADAVARAMRLIADGLVDREGVPGLAAQVGYSVRQLERVLLAEVGAGPLALARAQRAQTARLLIETTTLSMTEIAFASGFSSIRQFNDTVSAVFADAPRRLRSAARPGAVTPGRLSIRLPVRLPFHVDSLFGHLAATAVPGIEEIVGTTYRRSIRLPHGPGVVGLVPVGDHVVCTLQLADLADLAAAVARARRLLDLDADPEAIDAVLADDPMLAQSVRDARGRRVPRVMDGEEFCVRAVLGQQVSTAAARTTTAALVRSYGTPLPEPTGTLTHLFPTPGQLAGCDAALPGGRAETLRLAVDAMAAGHLDLGPGADRDEARRVLLGLRGIGPWTTEMVALRALGDPDAFPVGDLGVRRGAQRLGGSGTPGELLRHAERWRPWRAYAVQHLWAATDHPINHWPPPPHNPSAVATKETDA